MKAILIGATGATGKDLLKKLLTDETFAEVHIFVRRDTGLVHPKLTTHIINFDTREEWKHWVQGDVLFSALGTTLKSAGSKEAQWKIDYTYQYEFAKIAQQNGVKRYLLVSSASANARSSFYYMKIKGALEEAVKALGFSQIAIFNPPTLIRKGSDRSGENLAVKLIQFFNKLGILRSQKPMPTEVLVQAMLNISKQNPFPQTQFLAKDIWAWNDK